MGFVASADSAPPKRLVWADEFNGTTLDTSKWWPTSGCPGSPHDAYTCYTAANCVVRDGSLAMRVTSGTLGRPYDGCELQTFREASWPPTVVLAEFFAPVRIEARIKFAPGAGLWGAFWFNSNTAAAQQLELDVQEFRGAVPREDTCHAHGVVEYGAVIDTGQDLSADYHVYWMDFRRSSVSFGVDGIVCGSVALPDYASGELLRLSHMVGPPGTWGGLGGPPPASAIPAEMLVDWVRVYRMRG